MQVLSLAARAHELAPRGLEQPLRDRDARRSSSGIGASASRSIWIRSRLAGSSATRVVASSSARRRISPKILSRSSTVGGSRPRSWRKRALG